MMDERTQSPGRRTDLTGELASLHLVGRFATVLVLVQQFRWAVCLVRHTRFATLELCNELLAAVDMLSVNIVVIHIL